MRKLLDSILHLHRFLSSQLVYPLVLSSLLAVTLFIGRVLQSHNLTYHYLLWNLFLAWVPYLCSVGAAVSNKIFPKRGWFLLIPGILWLIFFPNAPYILTDFFHLDDHPYIPLWYDVVMLASFAWTGCILAIVSLRTMQLLVRKYLGWLAGWLFAFTSVFLCGMGVYMGRFLRWNSWDLFYQPLQIFNDITERFADPFNNLRFFVFSILFSMFLLVIYLAFVSLQRVNETETIPQEKP
jgi:uncharacterized membrane protein